MINLLSEEEKIKTEKIRKYKKAFSIMVFALFSFLVFIFSAYFFRQFLEMKVNKISLTLLKKEESLIRNREIKLHEVAERMNKNTIEIRKFWREQFYYAPIFVRLSKILPENVFITKMFVQKKEKDLKNIEGKVVGKNIFAEVYVYGWAEERKDIFSFKENLEREDWIKDVYFTPESWVKPRNVDFSLIFKAENDSIK